MSYDDASDWYGRTLPRPVIRRIPETVRVGGIFCHDAFYTIPIIRFDYKKYEVFDVKIIRKGKDGNNR